jgi:hypothetical protein
MAFRPDTTLVWIGRESVRDTSYMIVFGRTWDVVNVVLTWFSVCPTIGVVCGKVGVVLTVDGGETYFGTGVGGWDRDLGEVCTEGEGFG